MAGGVNPNDPNSVDESADLQAPADKSLGAQPDSWNPYSSGDFNLTPAGAERSMFTRDVSPYFQGFQQNMQQGSSQASAADLMARTQQQSEGIASGLAAEKARQLQLARDAELAYQTSYGNQQLRNEYQGTIDSLNAQLADIRAHPIYADGGGYSNGLSGFDGGGGAGGGTVSNSGIATLKRHNNKVQAAQAGDGGVTKLKRKK